MEQELRVVRVSLDWGLVATGVALSGIGAVEFEEFVDRQPLELAVVFSLQLQERQRLVRM